MNKFLLLRAIRHNWGMSTEGDWSEIEWLIYSDRSYCINIRYVLMPRDNCFKVKVGRLREKRFASLIDTMKDPWLNPSIISDGCDGEAWQFMQYSGDGKIVKTSGELGYIHGHEVLEKMITLLPGQTRIPYTCSDPRLYSDPHRYCWKNNIDQDG